MHSQKYEKKTRLGLWVVAMAGLGCGILFGNAPTVLASPTCWDKANCAQIPVSSEACSDLCDKRTNCGSVILAVGLGFNVVEVGSHDGYEDVAAWDQEACYLLQNCKSELNVECPEGTGTQWVCENDGDPAWVNAYDQGFFGDAC